MGFLTKFGGYQADGDLSDSDWTKRWDTAATATVLGIGYEFISSSVLSDTFTKALLHFDGADGSTTFTDDSPFGGSHVWTAAGNAQIDTAQSKFGGASLLLDGTGDVVSTPDHADFALGSGDFTVDCWFNCTHAAGAGFPMICGQAFGANPSIRIFRTSANVMVANAFVGAGDIQAIGTTQFSIANNPGWHHLAMVRFGNVLRLFIDGIEEASTALVGSVNDSASAFVVGAEDLVPNNSWTGWIDEFRLSVGVARYTSNFTPRAQAFQGTDSKVWHAPDLIPSTGGKFLIAVTGQTNDVPGIQAVDVDGQAGSELLDQTASSVAQAFWLLEPTSFADGDITITFNSENSRAGIAIWQLFGDIGTTYDALATATLDTPAALTVEQRNVLLGHATKIGNAAANEIFWSGITERVDETLLSGGTQYRSVADKLLITDESEVNLVASVNATPSGGSVWSVLNFHTPVAYFPSGQGVLFAQSGTARHLWSWDTVPQLADAEVLALVRPILESNNYATGVILRGGGSSGLEDGCTFLLTQTGAGLRDTISIETYVAGAITSLAVAFSWSLNTNYWMRFRARGTALQGKIWAEGTAEPTSWNIETTDSVNTVGRVGIFVVYTGSTVEVGHFEAKALAVEWPTDTIPNNWTISIQGGPQSNKVSFNPDIGPSIDRRRASAINRKYQVDCPGLTQTEYLAFVEFYHVTLLEGTLPFTIIDPFTGLEKTFKFGSDDPAYTESVQRSPGPLYTNGIYQVSFTVTRLD